MTVVSRASLRPVCRFGRPVVRPMRASVVRASAEAEAQTKGFMQKLKDAVIGSSDEAPAEPAAKAEEPVAPETPKPTEHKPSQEEYYSTADPRLSGETVKMILGLFDRWNAALASGKPENVAELYADNGVLLPTVSNSVRSTKDGLLDYFTNFLKLQPQGVIDEYGIRQEATDEEGNPSVISNSGIYTFTFGANGNKVQARYTYVYKKVGDDWKILSHHSSQLPTQLAPTPYKGAMLLAPVGGRTATTWPFTMEGQSYLAGSTSDPELTPAEEKGVLAAFEKWNNALATGNPENVVELYADDAVLLPTVADDVRTTNAARREYFVNFLKNKPQGALDEYHIRLIGRDKLGLPSAVSNQGIYTFEMGASGDKVQARYTYNYERVGNQWLIKKHHSSAMPETATAK